MASQNGGMQGLPADVIAALLAKGRGRNTYQPKLDAFIESDEAAINVKDVWSVELGGKEASTLYQGFNNVVNKADLSEIVKVRKDGEDVFLLHMERVAILVPEAS